MGKFSTILPVGALTLLLAAGSTWAAPAEAALVGRSPLVKRAAGDDFTQTIFSGTQIVDPTDTSKVISGADTPLGSAKSDDDCAADCLATTTPDKCEGFATYRRRLYGPIGPVLQTKYFCVLYKVPITGPTDANVGPTSLPLGSRYEYDMVNAWDLNEVIPPPATGYGEGMCLPDGKTFTPRKYSDGAKPDIGSKTANSAEECQTKCDEVTDSNRASALSTGKDFWYACNGVVFGYNDMAQTEPFCFLYYINWDQLETNQIYTISRPPKKNVCFYNREPPLGNERGKVSPANSE